MTETFSARIALFATDMSTRLPARIAEDSVSRVTDTIGISIAARDTAPVRSALTLAREWGGATQSTVLGHGDRVPAPTAALVNGTAAHALDFDDTHLPSILHPSASAVPAALAATEAAGGSGEQLLAAIAVGNEVAIRLGNAADNPAIGNNEFFERGLHATSICGAIGSAVAAGMSYGLDAERIRHALGIAASMGAGLLEANRQGGSVKRIHCGWAAHAGVTAALFAREGLTAPDTVLEGRFGFFNAYTGMHPIADAFLDGLGDEWELDRCFVKPYPTNVFTHTGIDAAQRLARRGIALEEIDRIELSVPMAVTRTIANPREAKIRPESPYHAQFSGPMTFAIAYRGGSGLGLSLDDFTQEALDDPLVRGIAERVWYVEHPDAEAAYPERLPTIARVMLRDGSVIEERIMANLGTAERPLSAAQLSTKFDLTVRDLTAMQSTQLRAAIAAIPQTQNISDLFANLDWTR